ncbi:Cell division protein FtsI/penicillin-binding protein [Clostridiaceae bacterium JG1575]|nr:Cell division protein FtsI/penicillin-binding protein [Clostridiaceae bacterium JG1575]
MTDPNKKSWWSRLWRPSHEDSLHQEASQPLFLQRDEVPDEGTDPWWEEVQGTDSLEEERDEGDEPSRFVEGGAHPPEPKEKESTQRVHRSIRQVSGVMVLLFVSLISYIVYFQVTKAEGLRTDVENRRTAEERAKVLRGAIFDREGQVLAQSRLKEDGTQVRTYNGGAALGNIVGYVSDKYSVTGLEASMDRTLSADEGIKAVFNKEFLRSLIHPEEAVTKKKQGHSLTLSLDLGLQKAAYAAMDGRPGSVVVIRPKTGEILAMVSAPGFSADNLDAVMKRVNEDKEWAAKAPLINRTLHSVFAPGSTMKTITLSAGLEYLPNLAKRTFDDKGFIAFKDGTRLNNFNNNVYGRMNLQESFTNSSNYVFGNLGLELSNQQLRQTAEAFGFNKPIVFQGMEAEKSIFPKLTEYQGGEKALSAIGQGGVAATPLQMALVAATIANQGKMPEPWIIAGIKDKDGKVLSPRPQPKLQEVLTQSVAQKVGAYMRGNVEAGAPGYARVMDWSAAGKTGTAEVETEKGKRVHAWFTGFAPYDNPDIAIAVCMEDLADVKENTGAQQAIPVAQKILEYWLDR